MVGIVGLVAAVAAAAAPPPWQRTEVRDDCTDFDLFRQPFFGETHVHTRLSFDAATGDVRSGPREAYEFAQGAPIDLPPYDAGGTALRSAQLRSPLDFAVVTDHSEFFGEVEICLDPGLDPAAYASSECVLYRAAIPTLDQESSPALILWGSSYLTGPSPTRFGFCGPGGSSCLAASSGVWQDVQDAAEEHYDRTAACGFTTFVGYEWTGNPGVQNLHRNVIYRNDVVSPLPTTYLEAQTPEELWTALEADCLDAGNGCDLLAIPHNSNLSNGLMFLPQNSDGTPFTADGAARRAAREPVVEIFQHKGDSECHPVFSPSDELCGFEKWTSGQIGIPGTTTMQPGSFVRRGLGAGLAVEQAVGVNPFRFGVIGSTDSHNATPGLVDEEDFVEAGALGTRDATPALMTHPLGLGVIGGIEANPGGLAVVWAEENSRDAVFAAMRRREVYATSGTRPIVRFFGGRHPRLKCGSDEFVESAYRGGTPMGGEVGPVLRGQSPRFAVLVTKDPGTPGVPGTPLQRVQIVKGWVDAGGQTHEQVFEVAGDPDNGASVDPDTCATSGPGFDSLCAVWQDPSFDRSQRAFYYARVVENPICRWSRRLCNAAGIDCAVPATIPAGMGECCNPARPITIQERAWTSAIFYRPDAIARVKAKVRYGELPGTDVLKLTLRLGAVPAGFDLDAEDLTLELTDDDTIYAVTIPAGSFVAVGAGRRRLTNGPGAIRSATYKVRSDGEAELSLVTSGLDLSNADRSDHMVSLRLAIGDYASDYTRLWEAMGNVLAPSAR
jgi:hypothetical protein